MENLTEREKMVKRLLRTAMFWRSFLFWLSFPLGLAASYPFQSIEPHFPEYMGKSLLYIFMAVSSLFGGRSSDSGAEAVYTAGFTALAITLAIVAVSWGIGRMLLVNAKTTVSLALEKERAKDVTEMVEQGFLYMKKDSDTFAGAAKRKMKQFLLTIGIIAGCVVVAIVILLLMVWITR